MARKFLILIVLLSLFLLLILAGWGSTCWRGYFANPARAGLIVAVILGAGVASLSGIDPEPTRRGRLPVGRQGFTLLALLVASVGLVWFLPFADRRRILTFAGSDALRVTGLSFCCCGIAVRVMALAKLGKQFSAYVTLQENHELVQGGIYKHIRHPLYLSLLLGGPGFALVFSSVLLWPILLVTVFFVTRRIRQEERLLRAEFGSAFEAYRSRTWALVPLVL
jgi:protein-S-isoprenylcysteine O-methyltransferase Ste14